MMGDPHQTVSFNLVDRAWIKVELLDGTTAQLSIRELFQRVTEIRRVLGDSPAQDLAVLRILLVIYWRANRDDDLLTSLRGADKNRWWREAYTLETVESFGQVIDEYLDKWHGRFDLFDAQRPFMQVHDLRTPKDEYSAGIRKLVPDAESDYFTMRAGDELTSVHASEATRWLLFLQAWNYSGIKSGAVGDPRVKGGKGYPIGTGWSGASGAIVIHGPNLAKTFLLNTVPTKVFGDSMAQDVPVWERDDPDTAKTHGRDIPRGPCELLTWQIRRVRLFHQGEDVVGILIANGDRIELRNQFNDPMTGYRYSKQQSTKRSVVRFPKTHNASRTLWRGIEALLTRTGAIEDLDNTADLQPETIRWLRDPENGLQEDAQASVGIELVGVEYGPQSSSYKQTIHEELPMKLATLAARDATSSEMLITAAQRTMDVATSLGQFAGNLLEAAGGEYAFSAEATERFLTELNEPFKKWVENFSLDVDPAEYRQQWLDLVRKLVYPEAQVLVRGAGEKALLGWHDENGLLKSAVTAWDQFSRRINTLTQTQNKTAENEVQKVGAK
ncbi:type I-E CRISPR-associated protein Cse1/CasA [Auritidibacter sp. NML130574]|uniref:type I-E CRISPR-associated protein Cse1/CasA n=1 Tax=Auritidibacter sp. NML130574 TaxID=2170745 RepID=UPI000D73AD7C|nr:type I-E CRISPR-associated protein Cse1/CasA [Auritidibacter sp. NML130574]AXR74413.1 type I-E CRISPR-associated protein Cse1/CasA [Auritidibacter sp. NML130574]